MKQYTIGQSLLWNPKEPYTSKETSVKGVVTEVAADHCIVHTQGNGNNCDDLNLWLDDDTESDFKEC